MIKVQYRRLRKINEDVWGSMAHLATQSRRSKSWDNWCNIPTLTGVIGEFTSVNHAIESIEQRYGEIVKTTYFGCDLYWFQETPNTYIHIRFVYHRDQDRKEIPKDSPWKIGLNDHD